MLLANKVVAITGGFGALGVAVGQAVLAAGGRVALIDQAPAKLASDKGLAATATLMLQANVDLGTPAAAGAALQAVAQQYGGLDALVNIAGTFRWETVEQGSIATWDLLYQVNLRTAVNATKAALPLLLERAGSDKRIVSIGAASAAKAGTGIAAYAASKAGIARLTESLAEELKDRGITVNAVLPSIIDTAPNRADMPDADFSRWVQPAQIGELIVFLLSAQASAITGASIPIVGRV